MDKIEKKLIVAIACLAITCAALLLLALSLAMAAVGEYQKASQKVEQTK